MKRKVMKDNNYPTHITYRQLHSVLRDADGCLVYSIRTGDAVTYVKSSLTDIPEVQPNDKGQRAFRRKYIPLLDKHATDLNYQGPLYMYCIHEIVQKLRPVDDFTTNGNGYPHTTVSIDAFGIGRSLQPFCKESKRLYVNAGPAGNLSRTKDQLLEDTGARLRTKIIESITDTRPKIDYEEIYNKFHGKCFKCKSVINHNNSTKGREANLDHTLAHSLYYPYTTEDATLLCMECNQSKKGKWPSEFYTKEQLVDLSFITGIDYNLLAGAKSYNVNVILLLDKNFDTVMINLTKRFRKRSAENRITVMQRIIKDMNKFKRLHADYTQVADSIIRKTEQYITGMKNNDE